MEDNQDAKEAKEDNCDYALDHYDLIAADRLVMRLQPAATTSAKGRLQRQLLGRNFLRSPTLVSRLCEGGDPGRVSIF